ncbi:hypothetical protein CWO90_19320 [Bradyrhizobium sp. Leo121]|nr:hypothetical protein CWO90_19320 [Bradyrhizobium sp. Leo121]
MIERTKIGFVGLGQMGRHVARNLMKGGDPTIVCNRSRDTFASFERAGAKTTTNYLDLASCSVVFLCLPDTASVDGILLGSNGLAANLALGSIVIDLSTNSHAAAVNSIPNGRTRQSLADGGEARSRSRPRRRSRQRQHGQKLRVGGLRAEHSQGRV